MQPTIEVILDTPRTERIVRAIANYSLREEDWSYRELAREIEAELNR